MKVMYTGTVNDAGHRKNPDHPGRCRFLPLYAGRCAVHYSMVRPDFKLRKQGMTMITIIDYGAGNIKSVEKALQFLGEEVLLTGDPERIRCADKLILPGVGSFGSAMERLEQGGLAGAIREAAGKGIPLLGICLGLQLLFERSEESPGVPGLGLLKGEILKIPEAPGLKIPHMGWNSLHLQHDGKLFRETQEGAYVYFVHSYYLKAADPEIVKATADYGVEIHAAVEQGSVFGTQFHPEKSSDVGLSMLRAFA